VFVDDDAPRDVETETGPFTERLGGEERLEYSRTDLFGHAGPRVPDGDREKVLVAPRADRQDARRAHGADGVVDQVRPHLVEFGGVDGNRWKGTVVLSPHLNVPELRCEHGQRAV